MFRFFLSIVFLLVLGGCQSPPMQVPQTTRTQIIQALESLDGNVPEEETVRLANDIVSRTEILNREFERTSDPKVHNFLVKIGVKRKGLCYHYSDGLYLYLGGRYYPHYDFHLVGAHIGSYWREHNAMAVTLKGHQPLDGIVIDAWRKSGDIFVSKITDDKAYNWVHRTDRGCP